MSIKIEQSYWRRAHFSPPLVDGSGEIATVAKVRYLTDYGNPTGYSQVLEQLDASATSAEKDFIYGADLLAQADSGGGPAYLLGDHLGSTRLLTDAAGGAITNTAFDFSPYGEPLGTYGSLTTYPHAYSQQWNDSLLALQNHRNRWYCQSAGRWLSKDPFFDFERNLGRSYGYGSIDPIGTRDITGLFSLAEVNVTAAINVALTQFVLPSVTQFILRASLTAIGVDNAIDQLGKLVSAIGDKIGLTDLMAGMIGSIPTSFANLSVDEVLEIGMSVAKVLTVMGLVMDTIGSIATLVKLYLERNLQSAFDAYQALSTLVTSLVGISTEVKVHLNPTRSEILQLGYHPGHGVGDLHHMASFYNEALVLLFETMGVDIENSPFNKIQILGHQGPHTTTDAVYNYDEYIIQYLGKQRMRINGKTSNPAKRSRMFETALIRLGNMILENKSDLLDMITIR